MSKICVSRSRQAEWCCYEVPFGSFRSRRSLLRAIYMAPGDLVVSTETDIYLACIGLVVLPASIAKRTIVAVILHGVAAL